MLNRSNDQGESVITYAFAHCPDEIEGRFEESLRMNKDGYVPVIHFAAEADDMPYCRVAFAYLDY